MISVNDGGFPSWERGYWEDAPEEQDTRDPRTVCRCGATKFVASDAVCEDCGDECGCAACGGVGCTVCQ